MDRDIPSVPITTLAGVASLTDLLSEMPLPTPLQQTLSNKSLLFHPRVAEEARNLLGTRDNLLVDQLLQSLVQTSSDHIELKDHYAGLESRVDQQSMPELLKAVLEMNPAVFNGPQANMSRTPMWNHTGVPGGSGSGGAYPTVAPPYGQMSPCRGPRHTPQGSPASPAPARLPVLGQHRPSVITEQQKLTPLPQNSFSPVDPKQPVQHHLAYGMNEVLSPQQQQTQQQIQQQPVPAQSQMQQTQQFQVQQKQQQPQQQWANDQVLHNSVPQQTTTPACGTSQDFEQSLPTQRIQTVHTMNSVRLDVNNSYFPQNDDACFAQPEVNNHVTRYTNPAASEATVTDAKVMNVRGPSPAQASDAPPALQSTPYQADQPDKQIPITQPIVRLDRLSIKDQTLMQKSISEFAESQPELATKLGIRANNQGSSSEDEDDEKSGKTKTRNKDKKRSNPESGDTGTFSSLVGNRRRKRSVANKDTEEKEQIEPIKPKLRKVERSFVPVLEKLTVEELMETNMYARFNRSIDAVFETVGGSVLLENREDLEEPIIGRYQLQDLCGEAAKLKNLGAMQMIPADRLVRLLGILESSIRSGESISPIADPDDSEDIRQMWMETSMERVMSAVDASLTCMYVMTSPNMPKRIYLEDVIDRVTLFIKYQLHNTIFPSFDPIYRINTKKKVDNRKKKNISSMQTRDQSIILLYNKIHELVSLLAELLSIQMLTDTIVLHASSMGVSPFFVDNISELQLSCLKLVTTIFTRYEKHRRLLLDDILASIARLPSSKRGLRSYRLLSGSDEHIQMLTALVLQLIQCVVALPENLTVDKNKMESENSVTPTKANAQMDKDIFIFNKYDVATKIAGTFLTVFLNKCGNKNEEVDYRPLFENFVQDLLTTVNKPEWPATELLLSLLGRMLVKNFSNKGVDVALRVASLDYLGVIAARLRKDAVMSRCKVQTIDQMIKDIRAEENKDNDDDVSNADQKVKDPEEQRTQFLQRVLLDYLAVNGQKDEAHKYARHFYLVQWYRDAMTEKNQVASGEKTRGKKARKGNKRKTETSEESEEPTDDEDVEPVPNEPNDQADAELYRNIETRKQFYVSKIRPFEDNLSSGNRVQVLQTYIDYRSAYLISQYLASKRSFSQSFDNYLKRILLVLRETSIAIRTKAMKCMTMIVEADPGVLARTDMQMGVKHSLLDHSTSVREASVDLIGKFVLSRPELIDKYYNMLLARILDTGVSVRKRVIKILKDICIECPEFDKIPEICVKMIRRVNDEEGIRKLVMEVFQNMWFTPTPERPTLDKDALLRKVMNITDVVAASKDFGIEWFEMLLVSLFKPREDKDDSTKIPTDPPKPLLTACRQIVDCLIENVLRLEEGTGLGSGGCSERLVACLATLYLFAKIRPQLLVKHASTLQPYLSYKCQKNEDIQIISYVAHTLELVVPLIVHPSETFLAQLEEDLIKLTFRHDRNTVASCIACLGSIINNVTRNFKLVRDCFSTYFSYIYRYKTTYMGDVVERKKGWLCRAVFVIGLLLRHFDFTDEEVVKDMRNVPALIEENIKEQVFSILMYFLSLDDDNIQLNTLKAIGSICVRHYEFMLLDELKLFYHQMLLEVNAPLNMKIEVLRNIATYLQEEENRMIKEDQEWAKRSKEENLKEMGDVTSGMASTVIQLYLKEILQSFVHQNVKVRHEAMRVIQLVLQQGLVHPVQIVPYLICMSTDYEKSVSNMADKQLQDIEKKYPSFIHMKSQLGIRLSYQLQRILQNEEIVRGFRIREQGDYPSALNGFLYSILRSTKQQRRATALSVLKQFDEQVRTSLSYMLYLADNLAYFPYQVQDEPLFIIHQIDIMISVSGTNLLQAFKEGLLPPKGAPPIILSAEGSTEQQAPKLPVDLDDDDEEDPEDLLNRLPEDTHLLHSCITAAQGCLLLLVLKQHLKDIYGITDSKISQYSPTETAKVHEKAMTRRNNSHFKPQATLNRLKEGSPSYNLDEEGRKALINQYLDFKQLMLKLDPEDEEEENANKSVLPVTPTKQGTPVAAVTTMSPVPLATGATAESSTAQLVTNQAYVTPQTTDVDTPKDATPKVPKLVISNRRTTSLALDSVDSRRGTPRQHKSTHKPKKHKQKRKRRKFVSSSEEDSENDFSDPDFLV